MPVSCSVSIAKLSTAELRELDYRVMRHAFDSQNELGRLADERIYQADLAARLRSAVSLPIFLPPSSYPRFSLGAGDPAYHS